MRVSSLFDGISCGRVALERAGHKVTKYYASEIDKFAIQISKKNYPDIVRLGDVVAFRKMLENDLSILKDCVNQSWFQYLSEARQQLYKAAIDIKENGIDLLIGGSPCQGFSFAGKQLNFDDERSKLFFEFVRIKEILKPKYFFLENVRMKKNVEQAISKLLGKRPYRFNSNLVSAQNRFRLYWTNISLKHVPGDKGILLKDILQPIEEIEEKYFLKNIKNLNFKGLDLLSKSKCLRSSGQVTASEKHNYDIIKIDLKGKIKKYQDKSSCLTAGGNSGGNHSDMDVLLIQKGRGFNKGGLFHDKSPTLTSNSWENNNHVAQCVDENYIFRRLTPIECERLQTLPDNYTQGVSNSQRYKALGNGWTVDVIAIFFKQLQI